MSALTSIRIDILPLCLIFPNGRFEDKSHTRTSYAGATTWAEDACSQHFRDPEERSPCRPQWAPMSSDCWLQSRFEVAVQRRTLLDVPWGEQKRCGSPIYQFMVHSNDQWWICVQFIGYICLPVSPVSGWEMISECVYVERLMQYQLRKCAI